MKFILIFLVIVLIQFSANAQMPVGKVLIVLSSSDHLTLKDGKLHPTGYYLSELAIPLIKLLKMGFDVTYANPNGNTPSLDKGSDNLKYFKNPQEYALAKSVVSSQQKMLHPRKLQTLQENELQTYDAVFVPGGHAPMEDLLKDVEMARILRHFHNSKKPTALICHGPVALLSTYVKNQPWIYQGYRMTVFSTTEEKTAEQSLFKGLVKFYPQSALSQIGGIMGEATPWTENVVVDRELITGQNPTSTELFANRLIDSLISKKFKDSKIETFGGSILPGIVYTVIGGPQEMRTGFTYAFAGMKRPQLSSTEFSKQMVEHMNHVKAVFGPMGLKGYFVQINHYGEFAFMNWVSQEASDRAFKSPQAKSITDEANSILEIVTFVKH